MSKRYDKFRSLADHPFIGKTYAKLGVDDRAWCRNFIIQNEGLSDHEFAFKVNRLGLDPNKPKRWTDIWALLIQSIPPQVKRRKHGQ